MIYQYLHLSTPFCKISNSFAKITRKSSYDILKIKTVLLLSRAQPAMVGIEIDRSITSPNLTSPFPPSPPIPHYPSPRTSLGSLAKGSWLAARLACFKYYCSSRYPQRPNLANPICRKTEGSSPRFLPFPQTSLKYLISPPQKNRATILTSPPGHIINFYSLAIISPRSSH